MSLKSTGTKDVVFFLDRKMLLNDKLLLFAQPVKVQGIVIVKEYHSFMVSFQSVPNRASSMMMNDFMPQYEEEPVEELEEQENPEPTAPTLTTQVLFEKITPKVWGNQKLDEENRFSMRNGRNCSKSDAACIYCDNNRIYGLVRDVGLNFLAFGPELSKEEQIRLMMNDSPWDED